MQEKAPIMEAMEALRTKRIVPFDVPGHKRGKGNLELAAFLSERAVGVDFNSMKPLDLLAHPVSVIKEAQEIAAAAFGASRAFFMVGGTTSSVQAMILSACKEGDKILLPRNVHKSALTSLVLSGAIPCYIDPGVDKNLGISLGMSLEDVKKAIEQNPDAVGIFLNNPTYYGICSDIKSIVELAHRHNMLVLADEAHGTHFSFSDKLPLSAMAAGADMAAVSMHKSGGALTQSSLLLTGKNVDASYVQQVINLVQTTSASYLLLASLDISRRNLALNGKQIFDKIIALADYARKEINSAGGYYAFGKDITGDSRVFDFDSSKLSVNSLKTGLAGIEIYDILHDEYDIQIELGDVGNFLAYISLGDDYKDIERLCSALYDIHRRYRRDAKDMLNYEYVNPIVKMSPKEAFYKGKEIVPIEKSLGRISGELIMCYPPGIPIVAPGEEMSREGLDYIAYAKEKGCRLTGIENESVNYVNVIK